jgi:hypothetical protein
VDADEGETMTVREDPQLNFDGYAQRNHPSTAKAAAKRIKQKSGTKRMLVLTLLKAVYPDGLTDQEMQDNLKMRNQTQNPRRLELLEMGWIEDSGGTRHTEAGLDAIVWRYVPSPEEAS